MKRILLKLAKWLNIDLIEYVEKIVEVPVVEYKERIIALEGTVEGDLTGRGNLVVEGTLTVTGGCSYHLDIPSRKW